MPKLALECLPSQCVGSDLRQILTDYEWKHVRNLTHEDHGHRCAICNGVGKSHPVELHERYEFDTVARTQKLVGLVSLCPSCHLAHHLEWAEKLGVYAEIVDHVCQLNGWSMGEFHREHSQAMDRQDELSAFEWSLDLRWLEPQFPRIAKRLKSYFTARARLETVRLRRSERRTKKTQARRPAKQTRRR